MGHRLLHPPAGPARTLAVGVATSALSLWLLARAVDGAALLDALRRADPSLVALAVGALFLSLGAKVARWRALLPADADIPYRRLFAILHVGMFLNNVLPLRAGDVTRATLTAKLPGLRVGHVVSSMVAERAVDGTTLLLCFVLVAPFLGGALDGELRLAILALGAATLLGVLLVAAGAIAGRRRLPAGLVAFGASWRRLASREGWPIWAWSATAWVLAFAINVSLFGALGIEVPLLMAVVVTCTTNLAMLVPASPGHVGVYHAAATVTLVAAGVASGEAASFSVLSHLVNVVPVSIVGAAFLGASVLRRSAVDEVLPARPLLGG